MSVIVSYQSPGAVSSVISTTPYASLPVVLNDPALLCQQKITKVIAEIVDPYLFSTFYTHSIYTLDKQAECVFRTLYLFVVLGGSPKSSSALPSFLSRMTITITRTTTITAPITITTARPPPRPATTADEPLSPRSGSGAVGNNKQ